MNKSLKIGIIVVIIALIGFMVIKAKNYYDSTYVGNDYYLKVPANQDTKVEEWNDATGKVVMVKGKRYNFSAYNDKGEAKKVEFSIKSYDDTISSDKLLQPNTYVKVSASKTRVLGWKIIKVQAIPQTALAAINKSQP